MLELYAGEQRLFNEETGKIITVKGEKLQLEHSLVSISKWEAKWHKPFLTDEKKTDEETLFYIKCMTLNDVNENVYKKLTSKNIKTIMEYINDSMTATWFSDSKNGKSNHSTSKETITSELIYYWMIALQIPFECQYWHIRRLLTLIHICSIKNSPDKKMTKKELYSHHAALNKARRAKFENR